MSDAKPDHDAARVWARGEVARTEGLPLDTYGQQHNFARAYLARDAEVDRLRKALALATPHLAVSMLQVGDTDDAIIVGHIRDALAILEQASKENGT